MVPMELSHLELKGRGINVILQTPQGGKVGAPQGLHTIKDQRGVLNVRCDTWAFRSQQTRTHRFRSLDCKELKVRIYQGSASDLKTIKTKQLLNRPNAYGRHVDRARYLKEPSNNTQPTVGVTKETQKVKSFKRSVAEPLVSFTFDIHHTQPLSSAGEEREPQPNLGHQVQGGPRGDRTVTPLVTAGGQDLNEVRVKQEASTSKIGAPATSEPRRIPSVDPASDTTCSSREKQPPTHPRPDPSATQEDASTRLDTPSGSSTSTHSTSVSNNTPQLVQCTIGNLNLIPIELMPYFKELAADRTKLITKGLAHMKPWPPEGFEEQLNLSDWEQIRRDTMGDQLRAAFLKRQSQSETTCAEQQEAETAKRKKSAPTILPGVRGTQVEKRPKGHGATREDAICLSD